MAMRKRKKSKNGLFGMRGIYFISIIMFFNLMGVGYGSWANSIAINSTVSTGSIDPVFSHCEVEPQDYISPNTITITSAAEIPAAETPDNEIAAVGIPAIETLTAETSAEETPDAEIPDAGPSAVELPTAETPAAGTPAIEIPSAETLAAETPVEVKPTAVARIVDENSNSVSEGNFLVVDIENAVPGYSADVNYTVINNGTMPVTCQCVSDPTPDSSITIEQVASIDRVEAKGRADGKIKIKVGSDIKDTNKHSAVLKLRFRQFNYSDR